MHSKILVLRFPKTEVQKPIVCNLARNFDLIFNILPKPTHDPESDP